MFILIIFLWNKIILRIIIFKIKKMIRWRIIIIKKENNNKEIYNFKEEYYN